jgi:hypothetical protein
VLCAPIATDAVYVVLMRKIFRLFSAFVFGALVEMEMQVWLLKVVARL